MNSTVFTIGHSTRPLESFLDILASHHVELLADVRTIPRSRHNPQYNQDTLGEALINRGIAYLHMPGLGGLRHAGKVSMNTYWRNLSFRGYADYMQTREFEENLKDLIQKAKTSLTAIMCAEAVPWRCHRSLIADALLVRDFKVEEIIGNTKTKTHLLTPGARVDGMKISYPGLNPAENL